MQVLLVVSSAQAFQALNDLREALSALFKARDPSNLHQMVQDGENPVGRRYSLPEGSIWADEGAFGFDHLYQPREKETRCFEEGATRCITKVSRSFHVSQKNSV